MENQENTLADISEETSISFSARFQELLSSLHSKIAAVSNASELPALRALLAEGREMTSAGAQWWVGYEMRRAQEEVRAAADALDAADRRLQPRKRFQFRARAQAASAPKDLHEENVENISKAKEKDLSRLILRPTESSNCVEINAAVVNARGGVAVYQAGSLCGRDILLRDICDARVVLLDVVGAVRASNLENCEVVGCAVAGSAHVTNARNCKFRLACRQMRIHESFDCSFWLDVKGKPIVEGCERVLFGRGELRFDDTEGVSENAGLQGDNRWNEVQDFSWLHQGQSPNWGLATESGVVIVSADGTVNVAQVNS